jgi:hypothetical protein
MRIQDICIQACNEFESAAVHGEQAISVLQRSEKSTLSELLARSRQTFTGHLDYLTRATDMQAELVTRALV